jgi:hypothetical protein
LEAKLKIIVKSDGLGNPGIQEESGSPEAVRVPGFAAAQAFLKKLNVSDNFPRSQLPTESELKSRP